MGYTHYWSYRTPPTKDEFFNVLMDIETARKNLPRYSTTAGSPYKEEPIEIKGGLGEGDPHFTMDEIWFNGDSTDPKKDLSHETFHVKIDPKATWTSDFCKTARKPYDFMVCICLLSLANHVTGFKFTSDGDMEDWQPAITFYRNVIGKLKPHVIEENFKQAEEA